MILLPSWTASATCSNTARKQVNLYGAPVYVRKQIVHNKHVVASGSEDKGAVFVEELDEVPTGATVVFSAHGVSPAVHEDAEARGLKTIDATCPLVTKVHHEAERFAREDYRILLIGHAGHEEVEGTHGEAPEAITLVETVADVEALSFPEGTKLSWLSQTTLSVDETMAIVDALREKFPQLEDPPSDDICYATQNRQLAVKEISEGSDLMIVVGSANSSNSVRLVEVALEAGAKASYRIDQILAIAAQGAAQGCKEALFTLGDRPEDRWPQAEEWLHEHRVRRHALVRARDGDPGARRPVCSRTSTLA